MVLQEADVTAVIRKMRITGAAGFPEHAALTLENASLNRHKGSDEGVAMVPRDISIEERAPRFRVTATYTTYAIVDPVTNLVVYVGQTSDFENRRHHHLHPKPGEDAVTSGIKGWLRDVTARGTQPVFIRLEVVHDREASLESETRWVALFARAGHPLLNRSPEHLEIVEKARGGDRTSMKEGHVSAVTGTGVPPPKSPPRHGQKWRPHEEDRLARLFIEEERPLQDIALRTGRTVTAVERKLVQKGLLVLNGQASVR